MKILYIIRGLPGSGKTTLAKELNAFVCEADQFFEARRSEPLFLRTDVLLEKNNSYISIKAVDVYEDERDNIEMNRGYIYYREEVELKRIIRILKDSIEFGDWE